jgi:hypothetical protein
MDRPVDVIEELDEVAVRETTRVEPIDNLRPTNEPIVLEAGRVGTVVLDSGTQDALLVEFTSGFNTDAIVYLRADQVELVRKAR